MSTENLAVRELTTFRTVVESGGINAASRRLGISRSVVSKRVADLETSLGVALFHRSTTQMVPTDAGEAFYQRIAVLLQELEETANALRDADEGLTGVLRLTVPVDAMYSFLGEAIFAFAAEHKALSLSVDLEDATVDLAAKGYDLGIRIGRDLPSSLRARRLCQSPRVLVASPRYLAMQPRVETLEDVTELDLIGYSNAAISEMWRFETQAGEARPLRVVPRLSFNNGSAMKAAAVAGLGITVLPRFIVADALRSGELSVLDLDEKPIADDIYAIYASQHSAQVKVRRFIDFLLDRLTPPKS